MRHWFFVVLALVLTASPAFAQTSVPKITGVYSSLRYNQEGGDLQGMELLVIPEEAGGYKAFVQIADGGAPFTAVVHIFLEGSRIWFVIPVEGAFGERRFEGELKGKSLVIGSPAGAKQTLYRGKSYWQ
jgi:hypothetical protein